MNKIDDKNDEKVSKFTQIAFRVFIFLIFLIIILLFEMIVVNGVSSVILDDGGADGDKVLIDCLGKDNIITLYAFDSNDEKGRVQYRRSCDDKEQIAKQYIIQSQKLQIQNKEDNPNFVNYIEYFDSIQQQNIIVEKDEFTNKICFTIELKKYSDVRINDKEQQQVLDYYECFDKENLISSSSAGGSGGSTFGSASTDEVVSEIFVNDKLVEEFIIKKPKKPLSIDFKDLGLTNENFEDKLQVEISNPLKTSIKVQIVDTNLQCGKKNFVVSNEYILTCNKTSDEVPSYFVQIKDTNGNVVFDEYTIPNKNNDSSNLDIFANKWVWLLIIGLLIYYLYSRYRGSVEKRDKKAIDDLEKDED